MFNQFSKAAKPVQPIPLTLSVIWMVAEDCTYHVEYKRNTDEMIALRTLEGAGEVHTEEETFLACKDSLLILPLKDIVSYRTVQADWHFYWAEFFTEAALPLARLLPKVIKTQEAELLQSCFVLLSSGDSYRLMEASALFSALLAGWLAQDRTRQSYISQIEWAVQRIATNPLHENIKVEELAPGCNMSLRSFRNAFFANLGLSPKEYMLSRKLEAAEELLRRGDLSVSEIAWKLGFCSPYYFSRIFKAKVGCAPLAYRRNR